MEDTGSAGVRGSRVGLALAEETAGSRWTACRLLDRSRQWYKGFLGVSRWDEGACTIRASRSYNRTIRRYRSASRWRGLSHVRTPYFGASEPDRDRPEQLQALAHFRLPLREWDRYHTNIYRVVGWEEYARTVTGAGHSAGGAPTVADPGWIACRNGIRNWQRSSVQ
jgi:hypothetical protein